MTAGSGDRRPGDQQTGTCRRVIRQLITQAQQGVRAAVREHADHGVDVIKVMVTGGWLDTGIGAA